jgi:hypothetical protein
MAAMQTPCMAAILFASLSTWNRSHPSQLGRSIPNNSTASTVRLIAT